MRATIRQSMTAPAGHRPLIVALALSLALHAFGIVLLPVPEGRALPAADSPIEVALLRPDPALAPATRPETRQIVAPPDEWVRAARGERAQSADPQPAEGSGASRRHLALAVPPVAPEWTLPGERGTLDHLPDIQRGDVTLLNTKANVFAPFVRRVGE